MDGPFHPGEISVQERTGERDIAVLNGRLIGERIPERALDYVRQQSYCALGWASAAGDFWATLLTGTPGFAAPDALGAELRFAIGSPAGVDGAAATGPEAPESLSNGDRLGALFLELSTRRRLRVNGRVADISNGELRLTVEEAFPNCPKYIQRRQAEPISAPRVSTISDRGRALTDDLLHWINTADTFFVASGVAGGPVDVSHRGGNPGFVQAVDGRLRIPDYKGNSMFGTLGNFAVNPHAGLVFIDFAGGRQLQLSGDVELHFHAPAEGDGTGGTGRWWMFTPRHWVITPLRTMFDWSEPELSPFNPLQ